MLVMQFASEGDLHNYLQRKFKKITWNKDKLRILRQISDGYICILNILNLLYFINHYLFINNFSF